MGSWLHSTPGGQSTWEPPGCFADGGRAEGGIVAQLTRRLVLPLELLPSLPLFIAVYSDLSVLGCAVRMKIPILRFQLLAGTRRACSWISAFLFISSISLWKKKKREREMLASFPLASLIYLEVLYVNVKLFILFIKFGTLQNNIYFFPLLLIRMVKIYTSFPSSS